MTPHLLAHTTLLYAVYMETDYPRLWCEVTNEELQGCIGSVSVTINAKGAPIISLRPYANGDEALLGKLNNAKTDVCGQSGIPTHTSWGNAYGAFLQENNLSLYARDVVQDDPRLLKFLQKELSEAVLKTIGELYGAFPDGVQKQGYNSCKEKLKTVGLAHAANPGRWM